MTKGMEKEDWLWRMVNIMMVNGRVMKWTEKVYIINNIGVFVYNNGAKYDGDWENGKRSGKGNDFLMLGIYHYSNGDKYQGDFVNDKKNGIGIYI